MKLNELFKTKVPYKLDVQSNDEGFAYFKVGENDYVVHVQKADFYTKRIRSAIARSPEFDDRLSVDPKQLSKIWLQNPVYTVIFYKQGDGFSVFSITGDRNAYVVFATVIDAVEELISELNARLITFSADVGEPSRIKMYERLVKRLDSVESFTYTDRIEVSYYLRMY